MTRTNANQPRGLIAVAVLIGLMVLGLILSLLLRSALVQRVAQVKGERQLQAEILAESGVERAAATLRTRADYSGETWEIPGSQLGKREDASVAIRIEKVEGHPNQRLIVVQADYPRPVDRRSRVTKSVLIEVTRPKRTENGAKP